MYRRANDLLTGAWIASLLLLAGLALDWLGFIGAPGALGRLEALAYAVPALWTVGFVHGAWHEHQQRKQADAGLDIPHR